MVSATKSSGRHWLITGCSSGFGAAIATAAIAAGHRVTVTARRREAVLDFEHRASANAFAVALDVTSAASIDEAHQAARNRFGEIDVLVNNAGYAVVGAVEEYSEEELRRQFDTNVFGLLAMTRTVLPAMRSRRSGTIVNLSSVAGRVAAPGLGAYAATKFAVEAFSESLEAELRPLGIRVVVVEPGNFRTNWAGSSMQQTRRRIEGYEGTVGVIRDRLAAVNGQQPGDPERLAAAIVRLADGAASPRRVPLGSDANEMIVSSLEQALAETRAQVELSRSTDWRKSP